MRLLCLMFLVLSANTEAVPLLMSWSTSIRYFDEHNVTDMTSVVPSAHNAIAVDYHYRRNEIYFSGATGQIKRAWLRPPNSTVEPITIVEVKQCDGIAVDWVNDNLYWTDTNRMTVEMSTLDGLFRRVLFNKSHAVENPRGIVLDPFEGLMFWTDWGSSERVESAGMDGNDKRTLVENGLFWPNGVTLDLDKRLVYILEAKFAKIISCNYDGTSLKTIYSSDVFLLQAFGLSFFANKLYWDSWAQRGVFSMDVSTKNVQTVYKITGWRGQIERMMAIKAVDPSLQKSLTVTNPCVVKDCSHKCVNGRNFTPSCMCPYGFTLQSDGETCSEDGYLLVSWRKTIRRYTFQGTEEEPMFDYGKAAISLAYHYQKHLVFWSDIEEHRIYRAPLGQLNNKTVVANTENCDGLAVDWVHDVLYWTDTKRNTLEAAQLDGSKRRIIFYDHLDQPRDIAVDPQTGYMFWTDWGVSPKIERAVLDGSERSTIVDQEVSWPNGITLEFEQRRIYWVDGKLALICSTLYDGSDRRTILEHIINFRQPFAITLYRNKIYWTDWQLQALIVGDKTNNSLTEAKVLANSSIILLRPNGVKFVHSSLQQDQKNPCLAMTCRDLCLGTKSPHKGHCMNQGQIELDKTIKNDSVELSISGSNALSIVIIYVKCVSRSGCSNDRRCSKESSENLHVFTNQTRFNISGLLPASLYNFNFQSPELNKQFQLFTPETDPPEAPKITSVEVEERSVTIKWVPVDTCVPGFDSYHYELFKGTTQMLREGNTSNVQMFLDNLQGEEEYTIRVYTSDPVHYSAVSFKTKTYEEPACRASEFLCNGVQECEDGSDESLETCAGIESIFVYKKNSSSISFRVKIPHITKINLNNFVVSDLNSGPMRVRARSCVIWPDFFCFTMSALQFDQRYNFQIQAALKDGRIGKSYQTSAITKEEESGPPEDLLVIGYTSTSVELQWRHPNQTNGNIRSFIISINEIETYLTEKCCQEFPILESVVKTEEPTYRIEPGSLSPASTYSIIVSVKNMFIGGSSTIKIHTPPPPMKVKEPNMTLQTRKNNTPSWYPQENLQKDSPEYHSLIKYYLVLILTEDESNIPTTAFSINKETYIKPIETLIESKFGSNYHVYNQYDKEHSILPILVQGFTSGHRYKLAWLQVSQYKTVYSLDYILSDIFTA